ncbi:219d429f-a6d9-4663-8b62-a044ee038d34 [Thermothielavioides terrestris]|uniref:219d429f-a6d9-4663-8b62-a044ee038d34 n=1 Tax=Thermothielavioides terrestris TaxID=2587410 RepID=A0A3S4B445_9PEZI|nr:219d429f-a6d9-4663-8b62-a044ee038d34 [Thermothielavioides terrestris]
MARSPDTTSARKVRRRPSFFRFLRSRRGRGRSQQEEGEEQQFPRTPPTSPPPKPAAAFHSHPSSHPPSLPHSHSHPRPAFNPLAPATTPHPPTSFSFSQPVKHDAATTTATANHGVHAPVKPEAPSRHLHQHQHHPHTTYKLFPSLPPPPTNPAAAPRHLPDHHRRGDDADDFNNRPDKQAVDSAAAAREAAYIICASCEAGALQREKAKKEGKRREEGHNEQGEVEEQRERGRGTATGTGEVERLEQVITGLGAMMAAGQRAARAPAPAPTLRAPGGGEGIGLAAAQRRLELERHYLESGDAFPMAYFDLWEGRVPSWLEIDPMGEFWEGEDEESEGILGTLRRTLTRESLAGLFGQREKTTELGSGATVSPVSTFSLPSPVVHPAVSDEPGDVSAAMRAASNMPSEDEITPDGPYSNMVADGESWFDDMGGTATRDKGKGVEVPVNLDALGAKHDRLRGRFGELNAPLLCAAPEGSDKSLVIVPSNSMDSDRPASCEL